MPSRKLNIAFIHPDLGIGGAERLVVDAALGLQRLGHSVDIYTSHHDPKHCFEETRDGTLKVHYIKPPFPRSYKGKFHILFAHLRQLHLTSHLLRTNATSYDVYFVDQLSTCVPFLRLLARRRVVFYCHFPDKLLAAGEFVEGMLLRKNMGTLKGLYRLPMDWLEELTTGNADIILANSKFTSGVFKSYFSISQTPRVVYPGINISAYEAPLPDNDPDVQAITSYVITSTSICRIAAYCGLCVPKGSDRPTFISLNRFEKKKNAALAVKALTLLLQQIAYDISCPQDIRLVLAGGYDPRLQDNISTLENLLNLAESSNLSYWIMTPTGSEVPPRNPTAASPSEADIIFLLNFTTAQRSALLRSSSTLALLYTPSNEHFGIGPVEGMICGLSVLACDSGGPTETVVTNPDEEKTGWLTRPVAESWAEVMERIVRLPESERKSISERARLRAKKNFGMDAMSEGLEAALLEAADLGSVPISLVTYILLISSIVLTAAIVFRNVIG